MAGWSSGKSKLDLPAGEYPAEISGVRVTKGKDFNDPNLEKHQFLWSVRVWLAGAWHDHSIYTAMNFVSPDSIREAQYTPKLMKLVRACGERWPRTEAEAEAWDPELLLGKRFKLLALADPEDPKSITLKFVALAPAPAAPAPMVDPFAGDAGGTPAGQHRTAPLAAAGAVAGPVDPWA